MKTNDSLNACPKCGAPVPPEAPQGLCPRCVFAAASAQEPAPTATSQIPSLERLAIAFPQLQIIELIGRGGMGFVFKARQPHLDRFVALKLLPDSLAHDPQFAERFNREGRVLARLNHPNIVSIFDFGQAGGFYYLMMEYVDGVNLRQAMQAGRFSPAEALTIVPKICEALQFAHEEGILHRDIKPENILLDAKGRVKIADFGIAKLVGEEHPDVSLTATGAALGTMHYMAPEQIEKPSTVDHRADIYSLGVVFYELLTGELPLGRFGPPSAKTPVDSRVDDVVMRTLEKEREKRFQSAGEMGTTVEHLTEVGAGTFKAAPPKASGAEPQRGPGGTMKIQAEHSPARFLFPYRRAAIAGILLLALIVSGTAVVNFFLPKTYSAKATFTHDGFDNPSEANRLFREILSGPVLGQVITDLDLKSRRSFRSESGPLSDERVMLMLRNRLTASRMNGTTLCDIRAFSENREEAAQLANAVVSAYCARNKTAQIIERAEASNQPISPKRSRNISIAFVLGIPIAAVGGVLFGLWSAWRTKRQSPGGTIAIKTENMVSAVPAWSQKAVWGAVLAGISFLPMIVLLVFIAYFGASHGRLGGGELILILASLGLSLPAIAGTILGWMGLSDIRTHAGQQRGLPFAVFAALAWPLLLLVVGTLLAPWLLLPDSAGTKKTIMASLLMLSMPAGAVTFAIWAVSTAMRWGGNKPKSGRHGVLKWVFIALLLFGVGNVILARLRDARTQTNVLAPVAVVVTNTTPWIRFTFTAVELREVQGVRWLAIDYLDDVHGECQKSFPWENTIPGFTATTRATEFLKESQDSSPAVRHQRIEYRMPDSIARVHLEQMAEAIAGKLRHKTFRLELGQESVLFEFMPTKSGSSPVLAIGFEGNPVAVADVSGGLFKARVKVGPPLKIPTGEPAAPTAAGQMPLTYAWYFDGQGQLVTSGTNIATQSPAFAPTVERTLYDYQSGKDWLLNLNSGETFSLPPGINWNNDAAAVWAWAHQRGIHVTGLNVASQHGLYGFEMKAAMVRETNVTFETITPIQISTAMKGSLTGRSTHNGGPMLYQLSGKDWKDLYAFETDERRTGVLQVTGFVDNPRGVKFRYKMVQGATPPSRTPPSAQNHFFGPEVERTLQVKYNVSEGFSEKLDLDTGMISPRTTKGSGIRASHLKWAGLVSLSGVDGTLVVAVNTNLSVRLDRWDSLTADQVNEMMADAQANPEILVGVSDRYHTYLFKTAANRIGILKTSDHTNSESGVKVRYRMVQGDRTESAKPAASEAQAQTAPLSSLLQFRLVASVTNTTEPFDVMQEAQGEGRRPRTHFVLHPVLMDGSAVARAGIQLETNGTRTIGIELTAEGARRFESITASNVMRQLAIVSGGRVLSAPIIRTAIPGGVLNLSGGRSASEVHKLVAELNGKPAGLEFSPVIERSLPRAPEGSAVVLDLDSGFFKTNHTFRPGERASRDWLQTSGADLHAVGAANQIPVIDAFGLASIEAPANAWDSMLPQDIGWNWAWRRVLAKEESQLAAMPGRPDTFLFRTWQNGFGLLQIISVTNPSPVVKIRYKLVQDAAAPRAIPASAQNHSFGPVVVRTLSFNKDLQDGFLDLDTSRLLTPPKDIAPLFKTAYGTRVVWERESDPRAVKMREWLPSSGANLMAWGGEYGERLEMREGVALNPPWTGTNRAGFDQTDPNVVAKQAETFLKPLLTNSVIKIHLLQPGYDAEAGQRQDTFQFMTREGTIGVLQILNTENNPPGVKIRYKLLQFAPAK